MVELIGSIAGIIFFLSGVDQLIKTIRDGNANGLSLTCLIQILLAYILSWTYNFLKHSTQDIPLLTQYVASFVVWFIIFLYKIYPRIK